MEITLDIPESMARTLGYARESLPRRALEALLVDECAGGDGYRCRLRDAVLVATHIKHDVSLNASDSFKCHPLAHQELSRSPTVEIIHCQYTDGSPSDGSQADQMSAIPAKVL